MKKLSQEQFIQKVTDIHNEKYDYSLVNYINARTKIKIICPIHGEFEQTADNHIRYGCSKCPYSNMKENFIKKSNIKFNNKFNYDKVVYKNNNTKVVIICPKHGEFLQTPSNHEFSKHGCGECGSESLEMFKFNTECTYCKKELLVDDRYKRQDGKILPLHKTCYKFYQKKYDLMKSYNIKIEDYFKMFEEQKEKCKICNRNLDLFSSRTHLDHCHTTNKIRGIICNSCNALLGFSKDDISILELAILYLKNNS